MAEGTPTVTVRHLGQDRLSVEVRGHRTALDQPPEGGGEDTAPTPTELFIASLAGCVAFYAQRFLRRHGLSTEDLLVSADWAWAPDPLRVGQVTLRVEAPGLPPERAEAFSRVIEHCPIHSTLRQPPEVRFEVQVPGVAVLRAR